MTKDEALKLARRALWFAHDDGYSNELSQEALTAIKEALAKQNEFKPDWDEKLALTEEVIRLSKRIEELEAQPEPWEKFCDSNCVWTDHHPDCKLAQRKPLTDEEIDELRSGYQSGRIGSFVSLALAIEAKLKEKNT